ncbi:hypothetical protein Gotur_010254, partial [Gossypium turneri]
MGDVLKVKPLAALAMIQTINSERWTFLLVGLLTDQKTWVVQAKEEQLRRLRERMQSHGKGRWVLCIRVYRRCIPTFKTWTGCSVLQPFDSKGLSCGAAIK